MSLPELITLVLLALLVAVVLTAGLCRMETKNDNTKQTETENRRD